jgi:hypothetical protein
MCGSLLTASPDAFWRSRPRPPDRSAADARVRPPLNLRGRNDLLGLIRVQRAGAGTPALCQYLHRKQFGVDLRLERPGQSLGTAVQRVFLTKGNVPSIGFCHAFITRPQHAGSRLPDRRQRAGRWPQAGQSRPAGASGKRIVSFRSAPGFYGRPAAFRLTRLTWTILRNIGKTTGVATHFFEEIVFYGCHSRAIRTR